jgi:hypothetical protein
MIGVNRFYREVSVPAFAQRLDERFVMLVEGNDGVTLGSDQ